MSYAQYGKKPKLEDEYRPQGEATLKKITKFEQYDAEERRRSERRDYEKGRAEKRKKIKEKKAEEEARRRELELDPVKAFGSAPVPSSFQRMPSPDRDSSKTVYAKKFVKHGECKTTFEAVTLFRKVCNETVFNTKFEKQPFIDDLIYICQKSRRCFICEEDDFGEEKDKAESAIRDHFKSHKGQLACPQLTMKTFCGLEFDISVKTLHKLYLHLACCDDCMANISINYQNEYKCLLTQIKDLHEKLGFCPITLIVTDFNAYNLHHIPEEFLSKEIIKYFFMGSENEPFRSAQEILINLTGHRNEDKFKKCALFSPNIREIADWDQVLNVCYADSFKMGKDADRIRLDCIMNDGYLQIRQYKSNRTNKIFSNPKEFIEHILSLEVE